MERKSDETRATAVPARRTVRRHEAADLLGVGLTTLDAMLKRREIPSITQGRAKLIPIAGIDAWLAKKLAEVAA
jgi:excisionase family DNA binding protein